jgi:hypothetical protein
MISTIANRNSKQRNAHSQNSLAGACGVLLMLFAAQPGIAQQGAPVKPAAAATAGIRPPAAVAASPVADKSEAPGKSDDGSIKVHGHWLINVRNPDGTIADHREFENHLLPEQGGSAFLIGLLGGFYVPGYFQIEIVGTACLNNVCGIAQSLTAQPGYPCGPAVTPASCSASLIFNVVLAPTTGSTSIIMSGSVLAHSAGNLQQVSTVSNACNNTTTDYNPFKPIVPPPGPSTVSPIDCLGSNNTAINGFLTNTSNFTPVQITAAGQNIEVTVTITFA